MDEVDKACYIFIGRSGCGKGTQSKKLIEEFLKPQGRNVTYLETGSYFREFIKGVKYSNVLANVIYENGNLQPDFLAISLWSNFLINNLEAGQDLVLDGVARKLRESNVLDSAMEFYSYKKIFVIYVNIPREESHKRMLERGRLDDTPEEIEKRLDWFDTDVLPSIEAYRDNSKYRFIEVNGLQAIDDTFKELVTKLTN